jgi:ribosomal protein L37AE/L43A
MSDYRRPADYQINDHYECSSCGQKAEQVSIYGVGQCSCGGSFVKTGESYPASSDDWDEQRDTCDGQFYNVRPRY